MHNNNDMLEIRTKQNCENVYNLKKLAEIHRQFIKICYKKDYTRNSINFPFYLEDVESFFLCLFY